MKTIWSGKLATTSRTSMISDAELVRDDGGELHVVRRDGVQVLETAAAAKPKSRDRGDRQTKPDRSKARIGVDRSKTQIGLFDGSVVRMSQAIRPSGDAAVEVAMSDTMQKFEAAKAAIKDGEARNLSDRTMNKRWKEFFKAEDALKALSGGWS